MFRSDEEDIELTKMDAWSRAEDEPAHVLENRQLHVRRKVEDMKFGFRTIEGNDDRIKFYTGLPSWAVFLHLFRFLAALLALFMRLRLSLLLEDIALRFDVSPSLVSR